MSIMIEVAHSRTTVPKYETSQRDEDHNWYQYECRLSVEKHIDQT
jgi:hypothetical protein